MELLKSDLTGSPANVQVDIRDSGGSTIRSITGVPVGGSATIARMGFTTIFPAGTSLQGAQTWINNGSGIHCVPDFSASLTTEPDNYYHVTRSAIQEFTIEAPLSGSGATITSTWTDLEYKKYTGSWSDWQPFTSSVMLSAETLGTACYDSMFLGCTNLSNVQSDLLPAMALANGCYSRMFWQCENIRTAPDLPATVAAPGCYFGMFRHCTRLNSLKCYMPSSSFDNLSISRPGGIADTADPTPADLSTWTVSNLWTVYNKWLNNTCTNNGGVKGSFKCPSDMLGNYQTGDSSIGAVPTKYWTPSAL